MATKLRINRNDARYMCLRYAWTFISEAAQTKKSDFYEEFREAQIMDSSLLQNGLFIPTEAEINLIHEEANRLSSMLYEQIYECMTKSVAGRNRIKQLDAVKP